MDAYEAFASVYDIFMDNVEYGEWIGHIKKVWEKYSLSPARIIDLGCGTGNILLPLAKEGFSMVGADLSPEMLAEAEHKLRAEGLSCPLVCQDMTELSLGMEADCILSLCDSLNYLTEDGELSQAFSCIAEHLTADGLFLFDMNTEYKFREVYGQNVFAWTEDDAAYIWENDYDADDRINEYDVSFFLKQENGLYERTEECHYERAYSIEEITAALEENGMELLEVSDGYRFAEPREETERLLFAAKRRNKREES